MSISWLAATSTDMSGLREMSMSRYMVDKATGPKIKRADKFSIAQKQVGHARVITTWLKWRQVTGVLCDHQMHIHIQTQGQDLKKRHVPSRAIWFRVLASHHQAWADPLWYGDEDAPLVSLPHAIGPCQEWRCPKAHGHVAHSRKDVWSLTTLVWPHHQKRWWYSGENSIQPITTWTTTAGSLKEAVAWSSCGGNAHS